MCEKSAHILHWVFNQHEVLYFLYGSLQLWPQIHQPLPLLAINIFHSWNWRQSQYVQQWSYSLIWQNRLCISSTTNVVFSLSSLHAVEVVWAIVVVVRCLCWSNYHSQHNMYYTVSINNESETLHQCCILVTIPTNYVIILCLPELQVNKEWMAGGGTIRDCNNAIIDCNGLWIALTWPPWCS